MRELPDTHDETLQVLALVASAGGITAVSEVLEGLPGNLKRGGNRAHSPTARSSECPCPHSPAPIEAARTTSPRQCSPACRNCSCCPSRTTPVDRPRPNRGSGHLRRAPAKSSLSGPVADHAGHNMWPSGNGGRALRRGSRRCHRGQCCAPLRRNRDCLRRGVLRTLRHTTGDDRTELPHRSDRRRQRHRRLAGSPRGTKHRFAVARDAGSPSPPPGACRTADMGDRGRTRPRPVTRKTAQVDVEGAYLDTTSSRRPAHPHCPNQVTSPVMSPTPSPPGSSTISSPRGVPAQAGCELSSHPAASPTPARREDAACERQPREPRL